MARLFSSVVRNGSLLLLSAGVLAFSACGDDDDDDDTDTGPTPMRDMGPPDPDTGPDPDRDMGPGPVDGGPDLEPLACDVVVIGGGAGGLHTAFRLAPELGEDVCLFERESELGGRIHDVPMDPSNPESPRVGTGARRVMEGQQVLFDLATELGIELEVAPGQADLISARGAFAFGKDALFPLYPGAPADPDADDHESFLYDTLRFSPMRAMAPSHPDFRSYIRALVGTQGFNFLHDMSRFRADFEYPLDARGYLDYLDEEWDVCCTPSYPIGGMSTFIRGMEAAAREDGARIFTDEPVVALRSADEGYEIETEEYLVSAQRVVVAIPPVAFNHIEGDIAEQIRAEGEYQSILEVKVATITQWWPSSWWETVRNPDLTEDNQVWRAWTTDHCLNFIEIPLEPYAAAQHVTRTVYDDDLNCVNFWEELARTGTDAVEEEIRRGLEVLFNENGLTTPVTIPDPIRTYVQIWPAAWHWIRAGAPYTNAQVFDWAAEPIAGEEICMVGEAYNPQRSGWSDGAYKSSINALNERFGMSIPLPSPMASRTRRATRGQGG
ncbi:MAG: FAD-dependent oxidoreductase, partial [Deltaproteobacteria bacterium]|nr:FAD-dependent oxidoreductase [Deltaproteobacteria bacterium]